jgi:hypothetical protein
VGAWSFILKLTLFNGAAEDHQSLGVFCVFLPGTFRLPPLPPSLNLPLVADSHAVKMARSPRILWTVVFQISWIAQSPNSSAYKEHQMFVLSASKVYVLCFGICPQAGSPISYPSFL